MATNKKWKYARTIPCFYSNLNKSDSPKAAAIGGFRLSLLVKIDLQIWMRNLVIWNCNQQHRDSARLFADDMVMLDVNLIWKFEYFINLSKDWAHSVNMSEVSCQKLEIKLSF